MAFKIRNSMLMIIRQTCDQFDCFALPFARYIFFIVNLLNQSIVLYQLLRKRTGFFVVFFFPPEKCWSCINCSIFYRALFLFEWHMQVGQTKKKLVNSKKCQIPNEYIERKTATALYLKIILIKIKMKTNSNRTCKIFMETIDRFAAVCSQRIHNIVLSFFFLNSFYSDLGNSGFHWIIHFIFLSEKSWHRYQIVLDLFEAIAVVVVAVVHWIKWFAIADTILEYHSKVPALKKLCIAYHYYRWWINVRPQKYTRPEGYQLSYWMIFQL